MDFGGEPAEGDLQRPVQLAALQRRRVRFEALQTGGVFALFPLGALCAPIGWTREERGTL